MYDQPIKFSETGKYGDVPSYEDDVYTVKEFMEYVTTGSFIDYDGYGHPVKDKMADGSIIIKPSKVYRIPYDATHVVWYNR